VPSLAERIYQPYWPYLPMDEPSSGMPYRSPSELPFVEKKSCGTPVYMAPELFACEPYSFGVDFWAAAITLFIMLTGSVRIHLNIPHVDSNLSLPLLRN
jgi:serine/threonine protein kinase